MTKSNTKRFVGAAWSLLTFQLIASAGAVAVTAWAAFEVQPRLAQQPQPAQVQEATTGPTEVGGPAGPEAPSAQNTGAGAVTIAGEVAVGARMVAMFQADPDGLRTAPTYQWLRDGAAIEGAVDQIYVPGPNDAGRSFSVRATYVDGAGFSETVTSPAVSVPDAAPAVEVPMCQRVENFIRVPADAGWCNTGINVRAGQGFIISARGRWSNLGAPRYGPEGDRGVRLTNTIMPTADLGALIGRVGEGTFAIGAGARHATRAAGQLHLSMNDVPGTFQDNQGAVDVFVSFGDER